MFGDDYYLGYFKYSRRHGSNKDSKDAKNPETAR